MTMIDGDRLLDLLDDIIVDAKEFPQTPYVEGVLKGVTTSKIFTQSLIERTLRKQALLDMCRGNNG